MIVRLENPVRNYAWGSPSFIPDLLGVAPTETPCAELWLGAHPSAPSIAQTASGPVPLDGLVSADPLAILGARTVASHGPALPFLLKVLAAARPLSIQAHPTREQARAGFARENAAGIPLDAPHRNYRDDNHKPELIVALEPFTALVGFRQPAEILASLDGVLGPELDALRGEGGLRRFFEGLMTRRAVALPEQAIHDGTTERHRWARALLQQYRGDIGVLSPFILNLVELAPGDALYLPAGQLHAYLAGAGLEIMASSDNVLRGGLTPKHVDVTELLATLRFEPTAPEIRRPQTRDGQRFDYETPATEFQIGYIDLAKGRPYAQNDRNSVAIALCTEGAATIGDVELVRGQSALVPASVRTLQTWGHGRVWIASVP